MATKQFTMDDRSTFANRVVRAYDKFMQYKLPFPLDPVADVYRKAFTDKEWVAMRYLQETRPDCVRANSCFTLYDGDDGPQVTIRFPKGSKAYPSTKITLDQLPNEEQEVVKKWLRAGVRAKQLREDLQARCQGVMGNPTGMGDRYMKRIRKYIDPCLNNPVQLVKLWPEVQPFMNKAWRESVMLSTMKTRLPSHVGYMVSREGRNRWATMEEFRAEDKDATKEEKRRFEELNQILLMLSLAKDVPEVQDYPTISNV